MDLATSAPKLSEVLFRSSPRTFASLAALPSNVRAIESGLLFATGLTAFSCVVGPSGWGKTHLLNAVAARMSDATRSVSVYSAIEFLSGAPRVDASAPLLLDDVQELFGKPKPRAMLRVLLERRVRAGRPTMLAFTGSSANLQIKSFLPDCREWVISTIRPPQPDERVLVLNQACAAEDLVLSPRLILIIARQMHGNGCTLAGALKRLRLSGPRWLDSQATLKACGLLEPFFADNANWDLRLKILRTAEGIRSMFPGISHVDLALFTMLREACLSESSVARVAGLEPAEAYLRASRFSRQVEDNERLQDVVRQFIDLVVESLAQS